MIAFALIGAHMKQHRLSDQLRRFQSFGEGFDIMAIEGAIIGEAQIVKNIGIV